MKRAVAIAGLIASTGLLLAACGSDDAADTPAPVQSTEMATPSMEPSSEPTMTDETIMGEETMVGQDPATWTPVDITMNDNGTTLDMVPGQVGIFTDLPANDANNMITVESDNPDVVAAMQATDDGTMQTNSGIQAVAEGQANIIVWDGEMGSADAVPVMQFTVNVTASGGSGMSEEVAATDMVGTDPSTWTPIMVTKDTLDVSAMPQQFGVLEGYDAGVTIESDNPAVVSVVNPTEGTNAGFLAESPGTATISVMDKDGKTINTVTVTVVQ